MHRPHVARLPGIVGQRPSNLANQHVQPRIHHERVGPDLAQQLGLFDDPGPVLDQCAEQVEGLRRQVDFRAVAKQLAGLDIDGKRSESNSHVNL